MFRYRDKPSITNRPDKPVKARKVPPSMNQGGNHMEKIITITENKVKKLYLTDAPLGEIAECFEDTHTKEEFITQIIHQGYKIKEYSSSYVHINYDEK